MIGFVTEVCGLKFKSLSMYKFLREYGITAAFVIHWLLYYFALLNNVMDWGFNGKINYVIQWGSLPLLGIGISLTFSRCLDDCNVRLLGACIFSLTLRFVVIAFKPWDFVSSSTVMAICGLCLLFYFLYEYFYMKSKRRKLYI